MLNPSLGTYSYKALEQIRTYYPNKIFIGYFIYTCDQAKCSQGHPIYARMRMTAKHLMIEYFSLKFWKFNISCFFSRVDSMSMIRWYHLSSLLGSNYYNQKWSYILSCEDVKIWCYKTTLVSILVYWANIRIQVTKTKQVFSSWTNSETIIFVWFVLKRQQKENRRPFHFPCSSVGLNYKTFSYYDYVKWYRNILWENMCIIQII